MKWKHLENLENLPVFHTMEEVDTFVTPLVKLVVTMEAPSNSKPGECDPMITAVK